MGASTHQPRGYDQWKAAGYNWYNVRSAKVDVQANIGATATVYLNTFSLRLTGNDDFVTDSESLSEIGQSSVNILLGKKQLGPPLNTSSTSFGTQIFRCKRYISNLVKKGNRFNQISKGPNVADEYFDHNQYTAITTNTDVSNEVLLSLDLWAQQGTSTTFAFQYQIKITYYVELYYQGAPGSSDG